MQKTLRTTSLPQGEKSGAENTASAQDVEELARFSISFAWVSSQDSSQESSQDWIPSECQKWVDGVGRGHVSRHVKPCTHISVEPQSRGLPREEGSNGRLSRSRDTRYGTRGPGSRADRNAKTSRHGLLLDCDARRRLHWRLAVGRWSVTLTVPHMVHLQDLVKLHTFVLGHLGALLLACFGFDFRFALVAFDLVSDSIWCEGVGVGVGARGGSTWAGGDYLKGALGLERRAILRTTNKARSHTHTQAQATQPLHRGPPTPLPTAIQQLMVPEPGL